MTLDTSIDEGELGHILHHETLAERFNDGEDILSDVFANRPAASSVEDGTLFWATDTNALYRSDGATWSALAAGVSDHGALAGLADDDHPQYLTEAEGDAAYEAIGSVATHAAAGDPHTGYRLESADHTHQSTGLQGGTLDHGLALSGLTDDDHTQYLKEEASGGLASEVPDHTHASGAEAGTFDAANLTSGASADGTVLTSDGAGGSAWEAAAGGAPEAADADLSDITISGGGAKTIATTTVTVGTGEIWEVEIWFTYLYNPGAASNVTYTLNFAGFSAAFIENTGDSTQRRVIQLRARVFISSTSLAEMVAESIYPGSPAGENSWSSDAGVTVGWDRLTTDQTGSKTVSVTITPTNSNTTQIARVQAFIVKKYVA